MIFPQWLESKFLEWQLREGERKTLDEFARYLNVSQPTISAWLNGHRLPTGKNVHKLARLGPEVYDLLGLARPDQDLQFLASHWHQLSEDLKNQMTQTAADYLAQKGELPEDDQQFAPGNS